MEFIIAQILGGIALIIVCISYFLRKKSSFMIMQTIANFFYASAFFVVGSYVGGSIVMISLCRCIYIYLAEKSSFKYTIHLLPVFIVLYILTTIIFWNNAFDFMPLISSILFTIGYVIKDLQLMRYILIIPNSILVIYNIITTTYASAVLDFLEIVVILVAIIKFILDNNKHTKIDKLSQN